MAETPAQAEPKAGGKLKTILTVAVLLVVEAVALIGLMTMIGGEPSTAAADTALVDPALAAAEKIVELPVLDGKLANAKTGVTYLYTTEIFVQVKQRHATVVEDEIDQFYNEIKAEINAIWRTSEPHHFQEPKLETLNRKVHALLNERFGTDPDSDEPILVKCVIVMGTGFRVMG